MTQMDQVTQSNSAQTEELSATAESLSEQAAQLMELIGSFTLNQTGRNQGDRQGMQPHLANFSTATHPRGPVRLVTKTVRGGGVTKLEGPSSRSRRPKNRQTARAVAVPVGPAVEDSSFEDF